MKMKTLGIFFISIMAAILLLIVSLNTVSTVSAQNATEEELAKLTEGQELQDESGLTAFNDTNTNTEFDKCIGDTIIPCIGDDGTVIYYCNDPRSDNIKGCFPSDNPQEDLAMGQKQLREQEKQQGQEKCEENGNIAPCIGEEGELVYYCDDPRSLNGTCMPSPEEWQNFLPSCDSINYRASCAGPEGVPVWTCDDPEFDIRKYPYGCIEPGQGQEGKETQGQEGKEAKSQDSKTKSYQLIVYLDDASPQNVVGDNFKILVYNSGNETILSAKPNIDFNDDHQKISPRNGYPIIQKAGQNPNDIRVCAQQDYVLNGKSYLHDDCYPIKQNIQKTYWYTIFDYGQIDGFEGGD